MRILSFDASTTCLHVALLDSKQVVASRELPPSSASRSDVAAQLIPAIADILGSVNWGKHDLQALVVGQGPGSFTGIRVAVITARTLAQTLGLPLAGVPYLDTLSAAAAPPVAVVLKASANKPFFYAAGYVSRDDDPAFAAAPPRFLSADELPAYLEAGKFPRAVASEDARTVLSAMMAVESLPAIKNVAAQQAQLAYDRLSLKATWDMPWQEVYPLYLQNPSVTVKPDAAHRDTQSQSRRP
jgi:tRNA threonylcarbamoyl adenosine modification protein YeaZ